MASAVENPVYGGKLFGSSCIGFLQVWTINEVVVVVSKNFGDASPGEMAILWQVFATEVSNSNSCIVIVDCFGHGSLLIEIYTSRIFILNVC